MEDSSSRMLFVEDVRSSSSSRTYHKQLTISPIYNRNLVTLHLILIWRDFQNSEAKPYKHDHYKHDYKHYKLILQQRFHSLNRK